MKTGTRVQFVQPVIELQIAERRIKEGTDDLEYRVEWTDADGVEHTRWCVEAEITEAA